MAITTLPVLGTPWAASGQDRSAAAGPAATNAWRGALAAGPHRVGFASEELTRAAPDGRTRTMTLSVWYPALGDPGRPASLDDLFALVLAEGQLSEGRGFPRPQSLAAVMTGEATALSRETAAQALATPALGRLQAEPAAGPFPLAIWSSRHATVLAQAPLSEVLASHGIVVATVWSSDAPLAFSWEDRPEPEKRATLDVQTDDLVHALAILRRRDHVDPRRTLVLAWSYGGETAARLQASDDRISGVIGLDATVVSTTPSARPNLRVPLVLFLRGEADASGLAIAANLTSPALVVQFPELAHGNFNALEGFLPGLFGAQVVFPWSLGGQKAVDGYAALVRMSVEAARALSSSDAPMAELAERIEAASGEVPIRVVHTGIRR